MESLENNSVLYQNAAWLSRLIVQITEKRIKEWLKEQTEDFFLFLVGINSNFLVRSQDKKQIENLLFLIIHLRLTGGIPISFQKKGDFFLFFINPDFFSPDKNFLPECIKVKNIILNPNFSNIEWDYQVKDLALITCNRNEILKESLKKYLENIRKFAHKDILITVFDDSEEKQAVLNRKIIKELRKNYPKISYISRKQKSILIDNLIDQAKKIYPKLDSQKFQNYIPYTFGGESVSPSYGRNRNFVSLFYQDKSFIMIDDDSQPVVQTIDEKNIFPAISRMLENGLTDLNQIYNHLTEKEKIKTKFLDVDFIGYFNRTKTEVPQFVKYSGLKDIGADFRLLKQWGISPFAAGAKTIIPKKTSDETFIKITEDLENEYFIYGEESKKSKIIKGLCCYFPQNSNALRITFPEDIRIEDLVLGLNYFFYYKKSPIETNFALFHQKTLRNITPEYIHQELLAGLIFSVYLELLKDLEKEELEKNLLVFYQKASVNWKIAENVFKIFKENKDKMLTIFNNCLAITKKSGNIDLYNKIEKFTHSLWKTFYEQEKTEYEERISKEINRILKEFCECLILWLTIKNIPLNDFG